MFGLFKRKKKESVEIKTTEDVKLDLKKEASINLLNLRKETVSDICNNIPDLQNLRAKVALVLDFSGSMAEMYRDGTVQTAIERIMPIANQFDDDGELDLWIFNGNYNRLDSVNINNFYKLADRIYEKYNMGTTNYAPVLKDVIRKYTKEEKENIPAYVFFLTDGETSDEQAVKKLLIDTCTKPIFYQFVGLGEAEMYFLEHLDNLKEREIDNANFFRLSEPNKISDADLYAKIFNEYPQWVKIAKEKEII